MPRCPECGGTIALLIVPESPRHLEPIATIACCGKTSCGWWLKAWSDVPTIEQMAGTVGMEVAAA